MVFSTVQKSVANFILNYEHLKAYTENFMYGIVAVENENGVFKIKDLNKKAEEMLGIRSFEIEGKNVLQAFPKAREMGIHEALAEVYKTGEAKHYKTRRYQDERIILWTENFIVKLPSDELLIIFEDKTKEKQIDRELHILLENTNDGYFRWELRTGKVFYSGKWNEMLGYNKNDIFEGIHEWESRIHPADRERVLKKLTKFIEDKEENVLELEYRLERKDKSYASISSRIALLLSTDKYPETLHNIHLDVSYIEDVRREVQKKVKELEKLNSALIGRELKMIELKKRIEELEKNASK